MKKLFCFGYGYTSEYVGHALRESDPSNTEWAIAGTTRDPVKRQALRKRGIDAHVFDIDQPLPDPAYIFDGVTHMLISAPPGDAGDPAFIAHAADILQIPSLRWLGYLSTTGVYGNRGGDWVDESSEIRPSSKRGSRRAKAEDQWLSLYKQDRLPVHIFRLAGIYGPGRSALDSVRAGVARRIDKPGHAFSRIHVEDIVNVLLSSMRNPQGNEAYNVCDDNPAPSHEVIAHACTLLKRPVPPLIPYKEADLAPITRSFYADNKRVSNEKIKKALGVDLKYRSYREGLEACLDAEDYALSLLKSVNEVVSR